MAVVSDPTEDALDAIKMCNAAKSCSGFRKETILAEAIADLLWAFHPGVAIKYDGSREDLDKLYANYLANANMLLTVTKQEQMTRQTSNESVITIKQLHDALHDAVKIRAAAYTCIGPRKAQIIAKAESKFFTARDAYERQAGSPKVKKCGPRRWFCF